jgi:chromosome segregation ATPase
MNIALVSAAAASIVTAVAVWNFQGYRYGEQIATMQKEAAEATTKAVKAAMDKTQADQQRKDDALREANIRVQKNQALARALDGDIDRVRDELATARADLSKASADAVRRYSDAQSNVVGACTARLVELAKHADQCASDIRLMQEAWPTN